MKKAVMNKDTDKVTDLQINKCGIADSFFETNNKIDIYQLLCFVTNNNLIEVVQLILKNKSFIIKTKNFSKILRITIKNESLELITVVSKKGIARLLIKHGTVINSARLEYDSPLTYAVRNYQVEMVRLLLDNGAAMKKNSSLIVCNLLHLALWYNCNSDLIESLLTHRNDHVNIKNNNGDTPLHRVVMLNRNSRTISILLDNGADINASNYDAQTSLNIIVKQLTVSSYFSYKKVFNTAKVIIEHVARMKSLDLYVSDHNLSLIFQRDDLSNYLRNCEEEIFLMKFCKDKRSRISFFDILGKSIVDLTKYAKNKQVIKYLNSKDLVIRFPIYGVTMERRLKEALKLKNNIEKCVRIFQTCFNLPVLPSYCIDDVLGYCSKYDIKNLSQII